MDENHQPKDFLDSYDALIKNLCQAQGAMIAITGNDQYQDISSEALSNVLWLVLDQIKRALEDAHDCHRVWDQCRKKHLTIE